MPMTFPNALPRNITTLCIASYKWGRQRQTCKPTRADTPRTRKMRAAPSTDATTPITPNF